MGRVPTIWTVQGRLRRAIVRVDSLDHLVVTVGELDAALAFYSSVLGMRVITFGKKRNALAFGTQELTVHLAGPEFEKAAAPTPSFADLCFLTGEPLDQVMEHLRCCGVPVIQGPVRRTGATGPIRSVYVREPDGNLIEIANRERSCAAEPSPGATGQPLLQVR
jgi:catechol 2,3-dioxygenase-like lactoylglutathione lyase family enzyme